MMTGRGCSAFEDTVEVPTDKPEKAARGEARPVPIIIIMHIY